jgi:rubrerythrin
MARDKRNEKARPASAIAIALRDMAELEAASVRAFERLADELELHAAPNEFVLRARQAAADEVEHARLVGHLAVEADLPPRADVAGRWRTRTIFEVALENAIEGCVYETYGAATALFQAQQAPSRSLRALFATIAQDETAHAGLAWDLDRWFQSRLSPTECTALEAAKASARARLAERLAAAEPAAGLGLPSRTQAARLCAATFAELVTAPTEAAIPLINLPDNG